MGPLCVFNQSKLPRIHRNEWLCVYFKLKVYSGCFFQYFQPQNSEFPLKNPFLLHCSSIDVQKLNTSIQTSFPIYYVCEHLQEPHEVTLLVSTGTAWHWLKGCLAYFKLEASASDEEKLMCGY